VSSLPPEELIARHEAFLARAPVDCPLVGQWLGGYYPAEQFPHGTAQWTDGAALRPADVSFAPFAEDYQRLYEAHRAADDDFFYVGSAYWGIPWLEAILGCPVTAAAASCRSEPFLRDLEEVDSLRIDLEANPWYQALERFTGELVQFAADRFPVCPPLLRGVGDAAAGMLGGMAFVTGFFDMPRKMQKLLDHCAEVRWEVLRRLLAVIPAWRGTHAAGGYPSKLWSRRTVAYYQEDSAALLNPSLFREFLLPAARRMCGAAEVNFIHLHSGCLYPVDIILEDDTFDVIEINIDHQGMGPPVGELLGTFRKVQAAGRPLLLWGELAPDDWALLRRELSPVGLSLQPIVAQSDGDTSK
jgi:hypothetical protein